MRAGTISGFGADYGNCQDLRPIAGRRYLHTVALSESTEETDDYIVEIISVEDVQHKLHPADYPTVVEFRYLYQVRIGRGSEEAETLRRKGMIL